jgi:hypothetical protein
MLANHLSWRVLVAAVVLPAAIACADQLGIELANSRRWQGQATILLFAGFMVQTALLAHAIGCWLPDWRWRFGVLAWALVLTNLLLFRAVVEGSDIWFFSRQNPVQLLTSAFLSAQISAVVVCFVLTLAPLGVKSLMAVAAVLPPAVTVLMLTVNQIGSHYAGFWAAIMLVQSIATFVLAAALRALGWQIVHLDGLALSAPGAWLQFSIRHLLIATTAAALVTAFGKAVLSHSAGLAGTEWFQSAIDGSLLGVLSLVAVWAALGAGGDVLRLLTLLALASVLAGLLWGAEAAAEAIYTGNLRWRWFRQTFAGAWWMGWTLLAGTFLASWLSVLRATGYRLVRQQSGRCP